MGEAKRLQVVDMNQFTKLINLLQKKESDEKLYAMLKCLQKNRNYLIVMNE